MKLSDLIPLRDFFILLVSNAISLLFVVWLIWRQHKRRVLAEIPTDCAAEDVQIVDGWEEVLERNEYQKAVAADLERILSPSHFRVEQEIDQLLEDLTGNQAKK